MRFLTPENEPLEPSQIQNAPNICVMDCTDPDQSDFLFPQCIFWNEYQYPGAGLMIGDIYLEIPLNFRILTLDVNDCMVDLVTIDDLIQHEHNALVLNPILSFKPDYLPVKVHNIYQTPRSWFIPKVQTKNYSAVPIGTEQNYKRFTSRRGLSISAPLCVFVADDQEKINISSFHISAVL